MALKSRVFDDLLHLASTSRLTSAVAFAAISFAICDLAVLETAPAGVTADLDADIPRQLIHLAAVFCRFALPLAFMVAGFATRAKTAHISQRKG
jgi:hypothetical protein